MGGCVSQTPEEREAKSRSSAIDRDLRQDAKEFENTIKILLLGAGESGKSTLVKQMKIIHGDGYSTNELTSFKSTIHSNLLLSVAVVIKAMDKLEITLADPSNQAHASGILSCPTPLEPGNLIPAGVGDSLKMIWNDGGFQECYKRAYEYQLNDSAPYYFEEMGRILDPSYTPNEQDVLRSRIRTTGVVETSFKVGRLIYRLVDVGGQRSERRKWIQCFDDVRAVLFVAALSGYDMTLFEDGTTNRLEESLNLFQAICNNKFFVKTSMILFLNKMDLFTDKIMTSERHIRLYFPKYIGDDRDADSAAKFIQEQFQARNMNKDKLIYPHFTTATDTSNIQVVFKVVLETIIRENLQAANLL
ncbi:guanine nucleotide-binding protein G(o) subunit alpha-like [Dysidea avara]|uniref:guanine nucleotide-binding protein G(o) subunit alpha-like n=1 Tax=Dysidea avara TaxID=196820 RepID=UPI00331FC22B